MMVGTREVSKEVCVILGRVAWVYGFGACGMEGRACDFSVVSNGWVWVCDSPLCRMMCEWVRVCVCVWARAFVCLCVACVSFEILLSEAGGGGDGATRRGGGGGSKEESRRRGEWPRAHWTIV